MTDITKSIEKTVGIKKGPESFACWRTKICDYCSEKDPAHIIILSRQPNGERAIVELCDSCLDDIVSYALRNSVAAT